MSYINTPLFTVQNRHPEMLSSAIVMKIPHKEKLLVSLAFSIIFTIVAVALTINWYNGMGDNATYADITLNIAKTGKPTSQVLSTVIDYVFKENLTTITPEDISTLNLNTHHYDQNVFRFHFTPIQYLLAPFAKVIPIHILWESLNAFSFIGILFLGYFFLRNQGTSIMDTLILLTLISSHPAWNYSIFGQIYIDRFFFLSAALLLFSTGKNKHNSHLIFTGALISALIIEKMAIITGIFLIAYAILYWKNIRSRLRLQMLFLGALLGLFAFGIIKFYLDNSYYSNFLSLSSVMNFDNYLSSYPNASQNLIVFTLVNLPLLLLGIFEWRALIIALIMMIPNIFGNIGGAEKTGWTTHYHTTYFPFLIWAAMLGYINLQKKWLKNKSKYIFYIACLLLAIVYGNVNQLSDISMNKASLSKAIYGSWPVRIFEILKDSYKPTGKYRRQKQLEIVIRETIPLGSKVSVPENLIIFLFQNYQVYYYPLGIDDADFIVININNNPALPKYSGIYTFLGESNNTQIDTVLFDRMIDKGYDVNHPVIYHDVAIIKRLK